MSVACDALMQPATDWLAKRKATKATDNHVRSVLLDATLRAFRIAARKHKY